MTALDAGRFADLLTGYCLDVQPRDQVLVRSSSLAAPLLLELQRSILRRDAWPLLRVELPGQTRAFYEHARGIHLDEIAPLTLTEAKKANKTLGIQAPDDVRALADIDPERLARAARGRQQAREATMSKRWCSTLWPTPASAQLAGMELEEFAAFVSGALFLDQPDPVAAWGGLRQFQDRLIKRLEKARELRIQADGTDLTLSVKGRTWVNSDGRRNMPSGEVFTGPVETSASGTVRFDVRSAPAGVEVEGVVMTFRDGARRLGEVGIGTNFGITRPVGAILFDEKIGGTVHLALGRSYPETGGRNTSAVHWDLICDLRKGGSLSADGELIQADGVFT